MQAAKTTAHINSGKGATVHYPINLQIAVKGVRPPGLSWQSFGLLNRNASGLPFRSLQQIGNNW